MGHLTKRLAATAFAVVAAFLVTAFVSSSANATTFHTYDFTYYIDHPATTGSGGEHAVQSDFGITANGGGESLNLTALGWTTTETNPFALNNTTQITVATAGTYNGPTYAYFDRYGAGIGVCQNLSGTQCTPSDDDNITGPSQYRGAAEILTLGFNSQTTTGLADLLFRNEGHTPDNLGGKHVYIGKGTVRDGTAASAQHLSDLRRRPQTESVRAATHRLYTRRCQRC